MSATRYGKESVPLRGRPGQTDNTTRQTLEMIIIYRLGMSPTRNGSRTSSMGGGCYPRQLFFGGPHSGSGAAHFLLSEHGNLKTGKFSRGRAGSRISSKGREVEIHLLIYLFTSLREIYPYVARLVHISSQAIKQ